MHRVLSAFNQFGCGHKFHSPIKLSRDGFALSHLMFVDELILFGEASMDQVEIIQTFLDLFGSCSRQKFINEKTSIFFSKNVHNDIQGQISVDLGFMRTHDFGNYLGVPAIHGRATKLTFKHGLEKAN